MRRFCHRIRSNERLFIETTLPFQFGYFPFPILCQPCHIHSGSPQCMDAQPFESIARGKQSEKEAELKSSEVAWGAVFCKWDLGHIRCIQESECDRRRVALQALCNLRFDRTSLSLAPASSPFKTPPLPRCCSMPEGNSGGHGSWMTNYCNPLKGTAYKNAHPVFNLFEKLK